jgi:glycosyltransferase involved in cell wall biosynthesis
MKIWQVDPVSLTPYYDLSLCAALAEAGHGVRFISSRYLYDPSLHYPDSITTDLSYFRALNYPALAKWSALRKGLRGVLYPLGHLELLNALKRHRPDVVHMQWSRFPRFDRALIRAVRAMGIPVVHTIHDVEPLFTHGLLAGDLRLVYGGDNIDGFIVHTEENRQRLLTHYPDIAAHTVHVIPLIVSRIGDESQIGTRQDARAALQADLDTFIVLFFGNIKAYKGLDVLLQSVPEFLAAHPRTELWIAGRAENDADRQRLEEAASHNQIRVVADYIPSEAVWMYHRAADVVVFPYHQISQSAALATALSYDCAVIVSDVGGLPDLVQGNGWIIRPGDPKALTAALFEAAGDPERLEAMRRRSKALLDEQFSPQAIARQHIALYEKVIAAISR